jgi:uncharacterized membrane protein
MFIPIGWLERDMSGVGQANQAVSTPTTTIDKMLGGEMMKGKKTLVGILGLLFLFVGDKAGVLNISETAMASLNAILGAYAALGMASKVERIVKVPTQESTESTATAPDG